MKRRMKQWLSLLLSMLMIFSLAACSNERPPEQGDDGFAILDYPDLPQTPADKDSWEYIENEDYVIEWYVDVASWAPPTGSDAISKKIKEDTGITVKFRTPVQDDGQMLATMIAGGDTMPDVMSVPTSKTAQLSMLAQQGYVYDINTLAEKWAPSFANNFPKDVLDWWAYANGKTYGIPNHYYSYNDVPEGQLQPNGGMMVRKDIFDAWQSHVEKNLKDADGFVTYPSYSDPTVMKKVPWQGYITTPEGFKEACIWALEHYGGTKKGQITQGLQLSQFKTSELSVSMEWLSEFFAIPFEDENGNYVYKFTTDAYAEMLYYLNDLYRCDVISNANFTDNYDAIGGKIASGQSFATVVTPQDYQMHFLTAKDSGYEYISMYITNEQGDAPVLADIRGYGYLFNMITTECERPDLVIKLFDYLSSAQGQRLVSLGVEGDSWTWADEAKTQIQFTEQYLADKKKLEDTKYGLLRFDLLINYQYYDNVQPQTNHGKSEGDLFRTNLKRPLTIYSYDYNATHIVVDAGDERFTDYNNALLSVNELLGMQLPKIIKAKSREAAEQAYRTTLNHLEKRNLELVITMNAEAYAKAKEKLGITVAWPPYMEGYVNPLDRTQPNGDTSLYRGY